MPKEVEFALHSNSGPTTVESVTSGYASRQLARILLLGAQDPTDLRGRGFWPLNLDQLLALDTEAVT